MPKKFKLTYQFQIMSDRKPLRASFMEAWNDMYEWVNEQLASGGMAYQILESAIWIETNEGGHKHPVMFYEARDRAYNEGWKKPKK